MPNKDPRKPALKIGMLVRTNRKRHIGKIVEINGPGVTPVLVEHCPQTFRHGHCGNGFQRGTYPLNNVYWYNYEDLEVYDAQV